MPAVTLDVRPDRIAVATIDQPSSRANVLSKSLWSELAAMLDQVEATPALGGLLLRSGKPGMFIAGADLNELKDASPDNWGLTRAFIEQGLTVLAALEALPI